MGVKQNRRTLTRIVPLSLLLFVIGLVGAQSEGNKKQVQAGVKTSEELIEEAFRAGKIDYETRVLQHVYARRQRELLDPRFRSSARRVRRCLSAFYHDVKANWRRLSPKAQAVLRQSVRRPTTFFSGELYPRNAQMLFYNSPGGHFKIWYVTTGQDAPDLTDNNRNNVPDYVERMAETFDFVYQMEVGTMAYRPPAPDYPPPPGVDNDGGGDARFDVYIGDIINKDFALGEEVPEGDLDGGKRSTAYLLMDNDFKNSGFSTPIPQMIELTAAHEFHHAIQDNYDSQDQFTSGGIQNFWYYEATSSWMENQVYPSHQKAYIERLPTWFRFPEMSLDFWDPFSNQFGDHGNGSAIFNYFLRDQYGSDIVRQVWETLAYRPGLPDLTSVQAIDTVLRARGSNLSQGLLDFFTWNYLTGTRSDGKHYKDASLYPEVYVDASQVHSNYPASSPATLPYPPDHFGSNYVQFNNASGSRGTLNVNFDGQDGVLWVVRLAALRSGTPNVFDFVDAVPDSFGRAQLSLPNWQNYSRAVMVVGVATAAGNNFRYTYSAQIDSGAPQTGTLTFNFLNGWNIAGVPFNLGDKDPVTWFGSSLRFVAWDPRLNGNQGGYRFYSGPNSIQLTPGVGYFVRSEGGDRQVTISNQPIPDPTQPFAIPLPVRNWILIANPFVQAINWDVDAILYGSGGSRVPLRGLIGQAGRGVEIYAWKWNRQLQQYELLFDPEFLPGVASTLAAGEGAFIYSNAANGELIIPPPSGGLASRTLTKAARTNANGWTMEIKAQVGSARDGGALIGMSSTLNGSGLQLTAPPKFQPASGFVSVDLIDPRAQDNLIKVDVRASAMNATAWDLVVTTNVPNADVTLSWSELTRAPRNGRLYLMDSVTNKRQSLRTTPFYTFRSNPQGLTQRRFRIEFVPGDAGSVRLNVVNTLDSPSALNLSYTLTQPAQVVARVLSPTGKVIAVIGPAPARQGVNNLIVPKRSPTGAAWGRGIYFLELTARTDDGIEVKAARPISVK